MLKKEILQELKANNVKYLSLQFVDILGKAKNVDLPESQFENALNGEIMFDGSSIYGFTRIEESDMFLKPDLNSLIIFPWDEDGKIGRLTCDIYNPDGSPFAGCPRNNLKRIIREAAELGYTMCVGPEPEFFLFDYDEKGRTCLEIHDDAGYFDLTPLDKGYLVRKKIAITLQELGFEIEASHHECAPGQHEVDFKYADALNSADNIITFTYIVRKIARNHGLHATFLPKPANNIHGSGMHLNQSLYKNGKNAFFDPNKEFELSEVARYYMGGILKHAKALTAVTNPLINSYKRLQPGFEAPVNIAWSLKNRSPLIRIPSKRGDGTRIELRSPDPSANPYLAIAACLKAGLEGIKNKIEPPKAVTDNVFALNDTERKELGIEKLPTSLNEAMGYLNEDEVIQAALGTHIFERFQEAKLKEWQEYEATVHEWEIKRYLNHY